MRLAYFLPYVAALVAAAPTKVINVRLITYNIRQAVSKPGPGEEPWSVRSPLMVDQLQSETSDHPEALMCFQEALYSQVQDLDSGLGQEWTFTGVGRDDGKKKGEASPIFYRPSVWELEAKATYWLSETPTKVGSIGWDASIPRIANVARFRHRSSGARIVYTCTHFDHQGQEARVNSAHLIVSIANKWSVHSGVTLPVFVGGDLNVEPDNSAYVTLANNLRETRFVVPPEKRRGYTNTYTAFTDDLSDDMMLDYIFVRQPESVQFKSHTILNSQTKDGVFISDHRPVMVDFAISPQK